ncbi:MAG: nickel-dependent lactate racemase [Pseudomonadota bacterium]
MTIELLFGKHTIALNLPSDINVRLIEKYPMPVVADDRKAIAQAFNTPINSPTLAELASGKKNACILICDITRPVPNGLILEPLVETLIHAGMDKENITIMVATGLHRPNEGPELKELIGSDTIFHSIRIENHFARDQKAHADLGHTSRGIPISIDKRFLKADLRIVTGLVEPHFMAGYSGGRKVVAPGVAGQDTILNFHMAHILENEKAGNCILEGNPLHQAQLEIIRAIGDIYAVNVVIDDKRQLGKVTFGAIEPSHLEAVRFLKQYGEIDVDKKFRTIVTSAGGYPLDKTYYQTIKGMVSPMDILEPGGTIIIASECSEGMGSPEFISAQKMLYNQGPKTFMKTLYGRKKARIDEWQTQMLLKPLCRGSIKLYAPHLTDDQLQQTCVDSISCLEDAIIASVKAQNSKDVAVIPEGPYVVPRYKG